MNRSLLCNWAVMWLISHHQSSTSLKVTKCKNLVYSVCLPVRVMPCCKYITSFMIWLRFNEKLSIKLKPKCPIFLIKVVFIVNRIVSGGRNTKCQSIIITLNEWSHLKILLNEKENLFLIQWYGFGSTIFHQYFILIKQWSY